MQRIGLGPVIIRLVSKGALRESSLWRLGEEQAGWQPCKHGGGAQTVPVGEVRSRLRDTSHQAHGTEAQTGLEQTTLARIRVAK